MMILGLGSNVGHRRATLRAALRGLRQIPGLQVQALSPVYISEALVPPEAPPSWKQDFLNLCVRCESTLEPEALLVELKSLEKKLGRRQRERWAPREIDIDILAWDERVLQSPALTLPHPHILSRPFVALPLCDLAPEWHHPEWSGRMHLREWVRSTWPSAEQRPFRTRRHPTGLTEWVAIMNLTPDSFSDGGKLSTWENLERCAQDAVEAGASALDLGAESTRPGATALTPSEEWQRLEPFLTRLREHFPQIQISLDTFHPETVKRALDCGIDWINDVTGFENLEMRKLLAQKPELRGIVMHHLGVPPRSDATLAENKDPLEELKQWFQERLCALNDSGSGRKQWMLDPGFGFGKSPRQQIEILARISELRTLDLPLFVGISRKSFLKALEAPDLPTARDLETAALCTQLAAQSIDYLRVHNVQECVRATRSALAIQNVFLES